MVSSRAAAAVVALLYWVGPAIGAVYYLGAKTVAFCLLHKPRKSKRGINLRESIAVSLSTVIFLLYVSQLVLWLVESIKAQGPDYVSARSRLPVYLMSSSLLWAALLTGLFPTGSKLWYPHIGAWTLTLLVDGALLPLELAIDSAPAHDSIQFSLHCSRLIVLLALVGSALAFVVSAACTSGDDKESEPLLSADSAHRTASGEGSNSSYGTSSVSDDESTDADSEDDDEPKRVKELRKQQQARLKRRGNWLAYIKDFRVLLPLVWPGDDLYVMGCAGVMILVLLADRALNVLVPRQMGILVDRLAESAGTGYVPYKEFLLWALYSWLHSRAGIDGINTFAEIPLEQYAYRKIGTTAFRHIMTLSMDFHNEKNSGELLAAIGQGRHLFGLVQLMVLTVAPMILDLIIAFIYVANLFDANMALIVLFVGITYSWLGVKLASWTVKKRRRYNKAWRNESKTENEALHNWPTVSHFNRAGYEVQRYSKAVDEVIAAEWGYIYLQYFGSAAQSLTMLFGRMSTALLAVYRVSQGVAPVGNFVTLMAYWSTLQSPLATIAYSVRQLSQMLIDSERLLELLSTKPSVSEAPCAPPLKIIRAKVEFRNVNFCYDTRKTTLKDISFVAEAGMTVALVGETGGGKSTLLKLLYRYYDVQENGQILIDDQDIKTVTLDSLRDSFGMVPQDPALFNLSIMENVRYARLDATDAQVHEACRAAAIHDKILAFPDAYESTVGERGVKLSGGELQRVAIARAILRDPAIVLLDEATSMVDAETEHLIQKAFKKLAAGRTTFVVAHRLSTIQHADLILVVSNGEIVERGTHAELFKLGGRYVNLWSRQLSKEAEDTPATTAGKEGDDEDDKHKE